MRILLIEDDRTIGTAVREHLAADGHGVDWARLIESAKEYLDVTRYELILLDLSLSDGNGIDLLRHIRLSGNTTPLMIISARDQIGSRIEGLNAGADDYLVKPFDLSELSARVAAVSRRYNGKASSYKKVSDIAIDFANRTIEKAGIPVEITAREWAVLERLMQTANAIVSKPDIEDSLYAFGAEVESNAVEVYVSRLRKKLGKDFVKTLRGIGYQVPVDSIGKH